MKLINFLLKFTEINLFVVFYEYIAYSNLNLK